MTDTDGDDNFRTSHDLASSTGQEAQHEPQREKDGCQHVDADVDVDGIRVDDDKSLYKVLGEAFPNDVVQDARLVQTIVQENAVGTIIRVVLVPNKKDGDDGGDDADAAEPAVPTSTLKRTVRVFVKRVSLQDYVLKKKDWPDLRRTLLYARTEARFYDEILPLLLRRMHRRGGSGASSSSNDDACRSTCPNPLTPHVYLSTCDFLAASGWIHDDEVATRPASTDYPEAYHPWKATRKDVSHDAPDPRPSDDAAVRGEAGWIVLECVNPHKYYQDSPLLPSQSLQCLQAVARLHAAAWQDQELLHKCQTRLSRASFHLAMRNPKELSGIVDSWDEFRLAFHEHLAKAGLDTPAFVKLGTRIQRLAMHVSQFVSPEATDNFATLIHGDYKSLNVFLPREIDNKFCLMVDFASCGVGLGMSDLAMHVRHAVEPQYLEKGSEEKLVRQYWEYLTKLLAEQNVVAANDYTWDVAWTHYKLAVVDYFRFFLGRMWKSATPDTMQSKSSNKNVSLINRSVPAAMAFLKNVEGYMTEIEAEYGYE